MKKCFGCLLMVLALVFSCALADQEIALPGGSYRLTLPDQFHSLQVNPTDDAVAAYADDGGKAEATMEIDIFSYKRGKKSLRQIAEELVEQGNEAELRLVSDMEMVLVHGVDDSSDHAPFVLYIFFDGDQVFEVVFWYATQEAADLTAEIISSIH